MFDANRCQHTLSMTQLYIYIPVDTTHKDDQLEQVDTTHSIDDRWTDNEILSNHNRIAFTIMA